MIDIARSEPHDHDMSESFRMPYTPPPRRRSMSLPWWQWALIGVAAVAALAIYGSANKTAAGADGTVTYAISGESVAGSITYSTATGQSQENGVLLPWQTTVDGGSVATVTAQASGGANSITCTITENGNVIATQTSNGLYAVVSCTART